MTRIRKRMLGLTAVLLAAAGTIAWLSSEWSTPHAPPGGRAIIEIPRRMGVREMVHLLRDRNLVGNEMAALAYIAFSGNRRDLKAGEYLFDRPLTTSEVVEKLARGAVHLRRFTVPEGLTVEKTATKWAEQGFGTAEDFIDAARNALPRVNSFDPAASTVEGYLFPETYFFPKGASATDAVHAMIDRFRTVVVKLKAGGGTEWPLGLKETVILASLVETEAYDEGDRPLIASVFVNRLRKAMLLQCDPTVIYALEKDRKYTGRLTKNDLRYPSPFNTYVHGGLPPTAIANPGYAALEAAARPTTTSYLYFVRGAGGRHVFSETIGAHNRAVAAYRAMSRQ